MGVVRGWESIGTWISAIYTFVQGVCVVDGEDAVEGFAEVVVEGLVENAEEVTLSKMENLLSTITEGATFSQEWEETIDG